jgi:hypothetical protein
MHFHEFRVRNPLDQSQERVLEPQFRDNVGHCCFFYCGVILIYTTMWVKLVTPSAFNKSVGLPRRFRSASFDLL